MPLLEQIVRIACAMCLCASHAYASFRLAGALLPRRSLFEGTATFLAVAMTLAALDFHLLIALHAYGPGGAMALGAVQSAAAFRWIRGARSPRTGALRAGLGRLGATIRRLHRLLGRSPWRGRFYFFLVTSALLAVRTLLQVPNSHDTIVYHAVKAAWWLQYGDLGAMWGPGSWEIYGVFPAGGEIYTSLAMLPFHHDLLATSVDLLMWCGTGFALWALIRELGVREPDASVGAAFVLGIPTMRLLIGSCYVEPALCFTFFLGVYFAVRFVRTGRPPLALLALAMLSVAASTKYIVMGTGALVGAIVVARACWNGRDRGRRLAWTLAGTAVSAALLGPWLLNNVRLTGHPFSPIPLSVFGVTLGVGRIFEHYMQNMPAPEALVWANEWPILQATFRLPVGTMHETVGIFAAVPLVLAPFGLLALANRRPVQTLVLVLVVAAAAYSYLSPGMTQVRHYWMYSYSRFLLPLLGLGTAAALALPASRRRTSWIARIMWAGFVVNAIAFGLPWLTTHDCIGTGLVGLMAWLWIVAARAAARRWPGDARRAVATHAVCAAVFLLGLWQFKDAQRYDVVRDGTVLHPYDRSIVATAALLDAADRPRTVAVTGSAQQPSVWTCYHLLGTWLQNRVLYVSPLPDGRIPAFWPSDGWEPGADFDAWIARLREREVTDLVVFNGPAVELEWAEGHPELFADTGTATGSARHFRLRAR